MFPQDHESKIIRLTGSKKWTFGSQGGGQLTPLTPPLATGLDTDNKTENNLSPTVRGGQNLDVMLALRIVSGY